MRLGRAGQRVRDPAWRIPFASSALNMRKSTLAFFVLLSFTLPSTVHADCSGGGTVKGMKRSAAFVFEGTVERIERLEHENEAAATLRVHRVWKGHVTEEMTVYYTQGSDGPFFKAGSRGVVFAFRLNPNAEQPYYVVPHAPAGTAWVPPCTGPSPLNEAALKELGRSRKPSPK
jgi:hypothetical protein